MEEAVEKTREKCELERNAALEVLHDQLQDEMMLRWREPTGKARMRWKTPCGRLMRRPQTN
jgi:hypothetical protein